MPLDAPLFASGIAPLDDAWGGLQRGGSYLLFGQAAEDIRLAALDLARTAAGRSETCLFISALEPKSLAGFATAHLGFDLARASRAATFRLTPMPAALSTGSITDDARAGAWSDLTAFVCAHAPALLVIDDLTPLARFEDSARFADAFDALQERLAAAGILFVFAAPNAHAEVRDRLIEAATGIVGVNLVATADADPRILAIRALPGAEGRPSWAAAPERAAAPSGGRGDGSPHRLGSAATPVRVHAADETAGDAPPDSGSGHAPRTGINYLDLSASTAFAPQDGFAALDADQSLGRGHYVAGDAMVEPALKPPLAPVPFDRAPLREYAPKPSAAEVAPPSLNDDLFEDVDITATLQTLNPRPSPADRPPSEPPPSPRLAFVRAFDAALQAWTHEREPFLAVALQMPPDHPAARRFHFILQALGHLLGEHEVLLADEARRRAVWLMPGRSPEAARSVFAALKARLREVASEADHMMQNASAAVVPNGHPFPNATEFLAHFYEGA